MEILKAKKEYHGAGSTARRANNMKRIPFSVEPLDGSFRTLCELRARV